jgi:hypothetical protein
MLTSRAPRRWFPDTTALLCLVLGAACFGPSIALAAASPAAKARTTSLDSCSRHIGDFKGGKPIDPSVTLTPDVPAQTINFGGGRGTQQIDVVLRASAPLKELQSKRVGLEVLRRLTRQSDTLPTVTSNQPTFTYSPPRINAAGTVITFTICVDGGGLKPGHYAGALTFEGPAGLAPADLSIVVNAKDSMLAFWVLLASGFAVFALLLWRGATTVQAEKAKTVASAVAEAPTKPEEAEKSVNVTVHETTVTAATAVNQSQSRLRQWEDVLVDPTFWGGTVLAIAGGVLAAWAVYSTNTAWGADPITDTIALGSAVLSAAGVRSFIATVAGK